MFSCSISVYQIVRALHYLKEKHNVIHTGMSFNQASLMNSVHYCFSLSAQFKCDTCMYEYRTYFPVRAHAQQGKSNLIVLHFSQSVSQSVDTKMSFLSELGTLAAFYCNEGVAN